ncbi:hypothetical protein DM02DRAFT_670062 [Periconia macrospinosa]|uniref:Uncharacterized protein n=1 Tax=Periconia macrospinosa TaxID=97972 RepID=A0A2V1E0W0_9PLEO|nr:hypothetical protein DM02DRAFT_670062 [Periconia macrospinosa]
MEPTDPIHSPPSTPGTTRPESKLCERAPGSPFVTPPTTPPVEMESEIGKILVMTESTSTNMFAPHSTPSTEVVDASAQIPAHEQGTATDTDFSLQEVNHTPAADAEKGVNSDSEIKIDPEAVASSESSKRTRTDTPHEQDPLSMDTPSTPSLPESNAEIQKELASSVVEAQNLHSSDTKEEEELPSSPSDLFQDRRRPPPINTNVTVNGIAKVSLSTDNSPFPHSGSSPEFVVKLERSSQEVTNSSSPTQPSSPSPSHPQPPKTSPTDPHPTVITNGEPSSPLAHREPVNQPIPAGLLGSRHRTLPTGPSSQEPDPVFNPQPRPFNPHHAHPNGHNTDTTQTFPPRNHFNGFNRYGGPPPYPRHNNDNTLRHLNNKIHNQQTHITHLETQLRNLHENCSRALNAQKEHAATVASDLLASLYKSQISVLSQKAELEREVRDLQFRSASVRNVEALLVVGQRVLHSKLGELDVGVAGVCGGVQRWVERGGQEEVPREEGEQEVARSVAEIEMLRAREVSVEVEKGKMEVKREMREWEASLKGKKEGVRVREEVLALREHHYKETVKEVMEREITARVAAEVEDRVREEAFKDGFEQGKKKGAEEAGRLAFVKGYEAAVRQTCLLGRFRDGEIGGGEFEKELLEALQTGDKGDGAAHDDGEIASSPPVLDSSPPLPTTEDPAGGEHATEDAVPVNNDGPDSENLGEKQHIPAPAPIDLLDGTTLTPPRPSFNSKPRRTLYQELNGLPSAVERERQLKHKSENERKEQERKERDGKNMRAFFENGAVEFGANGESSKEGGEKVEVEDLIDL